MANEIDIIMDLDPLSLSKAQLDTLISYHREDRLKKEAAGGGRAAKKFSGEKKKVDLAALGLLKPAPAMKRRF